MMVRLSRKLEKITLSPKQLKSMAGFAGQQGDVLALFLYGSYGTEWQTALSDVDLAVLPMPETSWDYKRELELLDEFCHIGRSDDINLVNLHRVPVTLQMRVLETGRLLYVKDEILLADFKERVIRRYCDFEPDLKNLYRDFDASLREEFL